MPKWFLLNTLIIGFLYFSLSANVLSQSTGGTPDGGSAVDQPSTGGSQQPPVSQRESEPPWYYYWPDENLNPFGMSTLGDDEGGSTFGKTTRRRSNLQVNPPIQEQNPNEEKVDDVSNEMPYRETPSHQESISVGAPPPSRGKKGPIYRWVDDNGVIQVTNDLGSVPAKYLDQVNINEDQIKTE